MLSLLASFVLGYLIGSFPAAYLAVRWKSRIDIREAGSGNVGTLNSFLVTRSKLVGGVVLALDVAKGVAAVWAAGVLLGPGFESRASAAVAAVLGHNFPVWIGFRGGRGLATAAGGFLAISWPVVPVWCALWGAAYLLLRSVNPSNAAASLAVLLAALVLPSGLVQEIVPAAGAGPPASMAAYRMLVAVIMALILVKHVSPVAEFLRGRRKSPGEDRSAGDEK